jgi:DNA-binding CsgD family transcriptional regulator
MNAPSPALSGHLHKIQMAVQCASGLLLITVFANRPQLAGEAARDTAEVSAPSEVSLLPLLFVAATLLHIAYGAGSGLSFPKVGHSDVPASAHIALLFTMPPAGALLDRGGRGCRLFFAALAVLVFAAPLMTLTSEGAARDTLFVALCLARQGVFLATFLLAERLIRHKKRLPFLFALAYTLPVTSLAGSAMARVGGGAVFEGGVTLLLALAFAFLALRLRNALADLPQARDEVSPTPEPSLPIALDPIHLADFSKTYGLSEREIRVLAMLGQRRTTEDIAKAMNVAEGTVRKYVSRILQKTEAPNRAVLMALFAGPAPAETGEIGCR